MMDNAVKEADELEMKIYRAMQFMDFNREDYKESEVLFRLDTIRGFLIIVHNDVIELRKSLSREK